MKICTSRPNDLMCTIVAKQLKNFVSFCYITYYILTTHIITTKPHEFCILIGEKIRYKKNVVVRRIILEFFDFPANNWSNPEVSFSLKLCAIQGKSFSISSFVLVVLAELRDKHSNTLLKTIKLKFWLET